MGTYYISVSVKGKLEFIECPDAVPVVIPGYEDIILFGHRPYIGGGKWAEQAWRISEATTGTVVSMDASTIEKAVKEVKVRFDCRSHADLLQLIAATLPKSPYSGEDNANG